MKLTKYYGEIPMAHVLVNHDRRCQYLHGHNYKVWVTVEGELIREENHPKNGMLIDFTDLKNIVKPVLDDFDHSMVLSGKESQEILLAANRKVYIHGRTTVENIAANIFIRLSIALEKFKQENPIYSSLVLSSLKMTETDSSEVVIDKSDFCNISYNLETKQVAYSPNKPNSSDVYTIILPGEVFGL